MKEAREIRGLFCAPMSDIKIRLVCATRVSLDEFSTQTALGKSLALYGYYPFVEARVFDRNALGLSKIYNEAIEEAKSSPAILVFLHDDVHLCDFHWPLHLLEGLEQFHVVGIAGNVRRVPGQPSWAFVNDELNVGFACEPVGLRRARDRLSVQGSALLRPLDARGQAPGWPDARLQEPRSA